MFKRFNTINSKTKAGTPTKIKYVNIDIPYINLPLSAGAYDPAIDRFDHYVNGLYTGNMTITIIQTDALSDSLNNPDSLAVDSFKRGNPTATYDNSICYFTELDAIGGTSPFIDKYNSYLQNIFNTQFDFTQYLQNLESSEDASYYLYDDSDYYLLYETQPTSGGMVGISSTGVSFDYRRINQIEQNTGGQMGKLSGVFTDAYAQIYFAQAKIKNLQKIL